MVNHPNQRPPRVIDPITAAGALIVLVALTALITYAAMILPGKWAATSGPPDRFRDAATEQAAQQQITIEQNTPSSEQTTSTPTVSGRLPGYDPNATTAPLPTPLPGRPTLEAQSPSLGGGGGGSGAPAALPNGALPTQNPYGDWPLTGAEASYWISIPAINLEAPVVSFAPRTNTIDGVSVQRLPVPNSFAVSWDRRSAPPGGPGNTVLSGHSNAYGGVFGDLDELGYGAEIAVWSEAGVFSYYVTSIQYVEEKDQSLEVRYQNARNWLGPSSDTRVTLITCWPESDSSQRLIVVATR